MVIKGSGSTRFNQIWFLVILKGVFWILFLLFYAKLEGSMLQRCESIRYSKSELLALRIGIGYNLFNTVHDRVMIKSLGIRRKRRKARRFKEGVCNKWNKFMEYRQPRASFHGRLTVDYTNLINIKLMISRTLNTKTRQLAVSTINIQSIANKHLRVLDYFMEQNLDLCIITETWLNDNCPTICTDLNTDAVSFHPLMRVRRGGRIGLLHKKTLKLSDIEKKEYETFELASARVQVKNKTFKVYGIYHPPPLPINRHTNLQFIEELSEKMSIKLVDNLDILITGDLNIAMNQEEDNDKELLDDWINSNSLRNLVNFSTHCSSNTLDLMIVRSAQSMITSNVSPSKYFSDHREVNVIFSFLLEHQTKSIRSKKSVNVDVLKHDLEVKAIALCRVKDINSLAAGYNEMLKQTLAAHLPEKMVTITLCPKNPWFLDELNQIKRAMRSLERRWVRNKSEENWVDYKELRNVYCKIFRHTKKTAFSNKVQEIGSDAGKLYKLVNNVLGREKDNPLPDGNSYKRHSEEFAEFFLDKISRLRPKLDGILTYNPTMRQIDQTLMEFKLVSLSEVCKHMYKLGSKKSALDPLPIDLHKECVETLVGVTTHIINTSLQEHTFPLIWKEALITPLIKKQNLP